MKDDLQVQIAIAIRMSCAAAGAGLVRVTPDEQGKAELSCPASDPESVAAAIGKHISETGGPPATVGVEGAGVFSVHPLEAQRNSGRVAGVVALVTGGAQGFGRGIAEMLAREGAAIAVADLNVEAGERAAAELNTAYGDGTAVFCKADVTDAASVEACVRQTVLAFGGLDMLISNAGVLVAGGLDELKEESFDLLYKVNYKGFFLCSRAAAAVMKLQHRHNPDHYMDIIQINSKSGLEGSNRNFAYAGGKFGGIGLVQSFALELVEHHIKVNAICPGNYFDGPLWSDPEKGLFAQYLKAGKVEGAKTFDEVKRFYVSKVPMKRGCLPEDVARAIFYAHDQTYETGQAIPVTGGQVMLR